MKNILYTCLILSLFSCDKVELEHREEEGTAYISLKTRSSSTSDFENGTIIRLAMFESGTDDAYLLDVNSNIYAKKIYGSWGFNFDGSSDYASKFGYIKDETVWIDIMGIYPYIPDADLTAVPFANSAMKDYMVAKSEGLSLTGQTLDATLNFERLTTLLNFRFKLKHTQNSSIIQSVTISTLNESGSAENLIISKGEINFQSREFTATTKTSTLSINKSFALSADTYVDFPIYLAPCSLEGATKLRVSVRMDDLALPNPLEIAISEIDADFEFKKGTKYNFHIEIDNYAKLKGEITKQTEWSTGEDIDIEI